MAGNFFEFVRESPLPEISSTGRLYRHRKTGLEAFHLSNEDEEKLFAFSFRTPPTDSTGVAHILEHSVLCGSRRLPLKDAFISLAKGSLNTFLNAMTHGDRTVYPAASIVDADFLNLFRAYADAVFYPLLKEEAFLQEGHRLVPTEDGAEIQGIVYSEMQGVYGSPEGILDDHAFRILFEPGHPYSMDSGGDPDFIPDLDYESFLSFHSSHYHPSNCKLFLYGKLSAEPFLEILDDEFLSPFGPGSAVPPVPLQAPFAAPKVQEVAYPAPERGGRTSALLSWLIGDTIDTDSAIRAEILSEILLGHDGSPLGRALRESGLGEDLAPQSGIGTDARQMCFQVGLRGIDRSASRDVEEKTLSILAGLRDEGIPHAILEAALRGVEFSYREIRRGSGPYGLRLMRRCMRGWTHGAEPERTLRVMDAIDSVKRDLAQDPRLFEGILDRMLVSNPHRALTVAYPEPGLGERKRKETASTCARKLDAIGITGRKRLEEGLARLKRFQEEPDSPEALASLPAVRVSDLPREIETIPTEDGMAAQLPFLYNPLPTNGISYLELAVDISSLSPDLLPWLPLFTRFISTTGVPGLPYHETMQKLALEAGGFSCILQTGSHVSSQDTSRPAVTAVFRLKAMDARFPEALGLVRGMLLEADTSDSSRLSDLYSELRNDLLAAIVPSGVSFAQARGASAFSVACAVEESWRGISQYEFLERLGAAPDAGLIADALNRIRSSLFPGAAAIAALTCDPASSKSSIGSLSSFAEALSFGAWVPDAQATPGSLLPERRGSQHEAFIIPAEVGFASASLKGSRFLDDDFAADTVLASIMTSGPLWESVRMKRGAYGAWADTDPLEGVFAMASYRDPGPIESLEDFRSAIEWSSGPGLSPAEADKGILSVVSNDMRPLTPEEKGLVSLKRRIFGITDDSRRLKRERLLSLRAELIRSSASRILDGWEGKVQTIFSGEASLGGAGVLPGGMTLRTLEL